MFICISKKSPILVSIEEDIKPEELSRITFLIPVDYGTFIGNELVEINYPNSEPLMDIEIEPYVLGKFHEAHSFVVYFKEGWIERSSSKWNEEEKIMTLDL